MFFECQLFGPVQLSRQRSTTSDLENVCPIFFVMYIYLDVDYLSSMTGCLTCFAVVVCVFFVCFFFRSFLLLIAAGMCQRKRKFNFKLSYRKDLSVFYRPTSFWRKKKVSERDVNRKLYSIMHSIALMRLRYFSCESSTRDSNHVQLV